MRAGPGATPRHLERHEEVVGRGVEARVVPVAAVREHRVVEREPALELGTFELVGWAGRIGAQRRLEAREVPGGTQECERQLATRVDHLVLEQAVVQEREPDPAVVTGGGAVDEPARHERGQTRFPWTALRVEPPAHDRERALRVGPCDWPGQREVGPQPMVAGPVVELGPNAQEALAGPELQGGSHVDGLGLTGACRARTFVADRVRGPVVRRRDEQPRPHGAALDDGDVDPLRPVDE